LFEDLKSVGTVLEGTVKSIGVDFYIKTKQETLEKLFRAWGKSKVPIVQALGEQGNGNYLAAFENVKPQNVFLSATRRPIPGFVSGVSG